MWRPLPLILERPVSVLIATLALVVVGFFSLLRLPVSLLPTLERPRLTVVVRDADRSREDLLQQVVEPLERRFLSLDGVLRIHSSLEDGECRLVLLSEWQTDVDRLRIDAERRLAEVSALDVDELTLTVEAGDRSAMVEIAVLGGDSADQRTRFARQVVIPELARLPGAGQVLHIGGANLRPVVRPHAAALAARGLTAADLVSRLFDLGQTQPAGRVRDGSVVRPLVVRERVRSLDELAAVRLTQGTGITLGEVARVSLEEVAEESLFRLDGEEGVLIRVFRAPGANAVALARSVRRTLAQSFPTRSSSEGPSSAAHAGLRLEVVGDASLEVVGALAQLGLAGLIGLLLGAIVLRVMLGSWRPTLALGLVVPASIVATFGGFYLWRVSLDIVSLAGLALAAGMLVDNAIVVLEATESARARGEKDPVVAGTEQIALALVASFLTTAVVFLPLIYLRGLARAFFGVQAFAIVTSLLVSLFLSLTLTPVLARLVGPRQPRPPESPPPGRGWSGGRNLYLRCLAAALRHPWRVGAGALAVALLGLALVPAMERELVPQGESRTLILDYRFATGLARDEIRRQVDELEARVSRVLEPFEVARSQSVFQPSPDGSWGGDPGTEGRFDLRLTQASALPRARRALRQALLVLPGIEAEIRPQRSAFVSAVERSARRLEVEVSAATRARTRRLAQRVMEAFGEHGTVALKPAGDHRRRPALVLNWDVLRLAQLGADPDLLSNQVRSALGGFFAGQVEIDEVEPEILVETTEPGQPGLVPVRVSPRPAEAGEGSSPGVVAAAALASVRRELRPGAEERRDGRPTVRLVVDDGSGNGVAPGQVEATLAALTHSRRLPLEADERVHLAGETYELNRSFAQLRLALGLAVILVFLTVAALYESLTLPLVVMTTLPLAAVGALGQLWIFGQSLNVMSFLGVILLAGIVVNNAIVLLHRIEQLRRLSHDVASAVREAARERYRPIVMTTLTTLLGMLPLALVGGQGVELRRSLALSVSGGLVTSLFASLFLVPVLYTALAGRRRPPPDGRGQRP